MDRLLRNNGIDADGIARTLERVKARKRDRRQKGDMIM